MKKVVAAAAVATLVMGTFAIGSARADTDVFGTQQQFDGSYRSSPHDDRTVRSGSRPSRVLDRPRPDFDPTPIPLESFQVFPRSISARNSTTTSPFAQQADVTGDEILVDR